MRAWQDTETKRRWAATPSTPPEGGSRAASQIGAVDMDWQDDGNRSGNLSGNPKGVRTDRFASKKWAVRRRVRWDGGSWKREIRVRLTWEWWPLEWTALGKGPEFSLE